MCLSYDLYYFGIDLRLRLRRTGQGCIPSQILILDRLHRHHIKFITHTELSQHSSCQLSSLLNIIGCACCHFFENQLFCSSPAGKCSDLVEQFRFCHKEMLALIHLHGVSQRTGGTWNNGNFLNRCGIRLFCRNQCMPDLMVGNCQFFFRR